MLPENTAAPRPPTRRQKKRDGRVKRVVQQTRKLAPHLEDRAFSAVTREFASENIDCIDIKAIINLWRDKFTEQLAKAALSAVAKNEELNTFNDKLQAWYGTLAIHRNVLLKYAKELGLTPSTIRLFLREKRVDLAAAFAEQTDEPE
jgi:hypothetical protein